MSAPTPDDPGRRCVSHRSRGPFGGQLTAGRHPARHPAGDPARHPAPRRQP